MENIIELNDCIIIADILNKAFMTVALQFNYTRENAPQFPAFISSELIEYNIANGLKMYGYCNNSKIIGCVGYSHYKDQIYLIKRLATLPEFRHLGVGKKLMEFIENKICESNGKVAELHAVDENKTLIEWYEKLGYAKIRIDEIKSLPFNSYVMNKKLA